MEKRRSINVAGASHTNPIPSASRRGPFVVSGAISGADPATGKVPDDLDAQCRLMFENVRRVIGAAGGSPEDIVKMTVWITDRALRPILNKHWVEIFPDANSRPARHTVTSQDFTPPMKIQCDLLAVLDEG
jgi:2-iminobutanoate/2-iminopropanoate deaminase